ncbi:hypothetical protein J8J40_31005, partial [Mycobacterium tuberculosis]|nr:hypothetical protein [Mycobacterium tuberculosis]
RPVSFLFHPEDAPPPGIAELTVELLHRSYNFHAIQTGLAYVGLYAGGLTDAVAAELLAALREARRLGLGLWPLDRTELFTVAIEA